MVTFQKNELVVVMRNPDFQDADEYFATVKYKKDYNNDIHAFRHLDDRHYMILEFKEISYRIYQQMREFVQTYNHESVLFIDWLNAGHSCAIRDNNLEGKADALGEFYSFKIELEIL